MKCDEVKAAINAYVDKELSCTQSQRLEEHMRSCTDCGAALRELTGMRNTIQSSEIYASAPLHLKHHVSQGLKASENNSSPRLGVPAQLAYSIPALLLGLAIGWTAMSQFNTWNSENGILQLLASAHVHSLMADHLTDIASSDSHTVKPWFHGYLDFSPPVHDLTQYGYPLIGGRLEYLAGDRVAALVYRHRQHTINLFIAPKTVQNIGSEAPGYNGYNIIYWDNGNLSYWAVSDLNLSDLGQFRILLNSKVSPKIELGPGSAIGSS